MESESPGDRRRPGWASRADLGRRRRLDL